MEPSTDTTTDIITGQRDCQRMALVLPQTWDEASQTATIIISSEGDVGDGVQLLHSMAAIRWPGRPIPCDIDHARTSASCWGAVQSLSLGTTDEGIPALIGVVKVDGPEEAMATAIPRLRSGSARFSIDARIYGWQLATAQQPLDRAMDWEPVAVSLVVAGQDPAAVMRSAAPTASDSQPTIPLDPPAMTLENEAGGVPAAAIETAPAAPVCTPPAPAAAPVVDAPSADAVTRELSIRRSASVAGLPEETVQELIRSTAGLSQLDMMTAVVREARIAAEKRAPATAGHPARVAVTRDANETFLRGLGEALDYRCHAVKEQTELAREYRGMRTTDMAREYLETVRGFSRTDIRLMSTNELIDRAFHTNSDLSNLVLNTANKRLSRGYAEELQTWRPLAFQSDNADFKPNYNVNLVGQIVPEKILEGGEYKFGTFSDQKATYQLFTYGKGLTISRQLLINDDLSAIDRMTGKMGAGCSLLESNLAWALLTDGANGSTVTLDGQAVFASGHNNTGTGAIGVTGIDAGVTKLRKQTDSAGNVLNIPAAYLIVPPELRTAALQFLYPTGFAPSAITSVNPFAGGMELIVEARLSADSTAYYYLAANPNVVDMIQFGYLAGESGPVITSTEKRNPDGIEMLVRHDFYATMADHRGFYRSTGV